MVKVVLLVCQERYGSDREKLVNALSLYFGMDLLVRKLMLVQMEKFGMFTLIVVNAQKTQTGMAKNVDSFLDVVEAKLSALTINVFALMDISGAKKLVFIHHVLGDKFGLVQNVHVLLA